MHLIGAITRGRRGGKEHDGLRAGECRHISASADHERHVGFLESNSCEPDDHDDDDEDVGDDSHGTTNVATHTEVLEIDEGDDGNEDGENSDEKEAELIKKKQDL